MDILLIVALLAFSYTPWIFDLTRSLEWFFYLVILGILTFYTYLYNPFIDGWVFVLYYYLMNLIVLSKLLEDGSEDK